MFDWVLVDIGGVKLYQARWLYLWKEVANNTLPALPDPKIFKAKFPNIPVLRDYRRGPTGNFWKVFPSNLTKPSKSLVIPGALARLAADVTSIDQNLLQIVCTDLREGARLGCEGAFRGPSKATNAPSAYEDGDKVTDAIADWLAKGFAFGPVDRSAVPDSAKISGIMTRPKPNGSVRIILNLSSPEGRSVNDGINSENFPAVMSSTSKWLKVINRAGRFCKIMKCDWSDAYKHLSVHPDDLDLQWFSWLGKFFCELCLVFGGASSAGLFDRLAKLVLQVVIHRSGINPALVIQHLDDCCAAAPRGSYILERFDAEFYTVASLLGVKLAPRDDPQKSFGPCTRGIVLGVVYDTVQWTWAMPEEKFVRLLHDLKLVMDSDSVPQRKLQSVVGKIIHVKALVASGRYNLFHLILANNVSDDPKFLVEVSADLKKQAWFWFTMLQVCSGKAQIPDPAAGLPAWAIDIYTDAAGGSWQSKHQGVGAVGSSFWVSVPWGRAINSGRSTGDGRRLDRIMSALELIGPLLALCAGVSVCRGTAVRIWVDNAGSVLIFKKGYSISCPYSSAIATAIDTVAAGIGCHVDIQKITRCSSDGALLADCLSKGAMARFWQVAERSSAFNLPRSPLAVPQALMNWIEQPGPDFDLGDKLLRELAGSGQVLGYSF